MVYVVIIETDIDIEQRIDIKGTSSLEKFTDDRIKEIYKNALYIYKVYDNSRCIILKQTERSGMRG